MAINAPNNGNLIGYPTGLVRAISYRRDAPARYSRRGPGLQVGIKPDLAHYGGCGPLNDDDPTGLKSADSNGQTVHVCGTSYAAPLIARLSLIF
jgi:hypothetical protein